MLESGSGQDREAKDRGVAIAPSAFSSQTHNQRLDACFGTRSLTCGSAILGKHLPASSAPIEGQSKKAKDEFFCWSQPSHHLDAILNRRQEA